MIYDDVLKTEFKNFSFSDSEKRVYVQILIVRMTWHSFGTLLPYLDGSHLRTSSLSASFGKDEINWKKKKQINK